LYDIRGLVSDEQRVCQGCSLTFSVRISKFTIINHAINRLQNLTIKKFNRKITFSATSQKTP